MHCFEIIHQFKDSDQRTKSKALQIVFCAAK